jgi:hypothetical protein
MTTNRNLKSALRAAALSLALAFGMTAGQAIVQPVPAQAGVIGKIGGAVKGAAKAVGGGVKKAAVTVGSAGKKVGVAVGTAGKRVGVGVGGHVKRAAVAVARGPVGDGIKQIGKDLRIPQAASAVKKAVVKVVR